MVTKKALFITIPILLILIVSSFIIISNKPASKEPSINKEGNYVVNGQEVPEKLVEEQFSKLSEEEKQAYAKEDIADAIVTQQILVKKAEQKDIKVTDEEVDDFIELSLTQFSISPEEYEQRLNEYGITEEEYKEELKQQILISKLINESIDPKEYEVTDAEVDNYIEENKEEYEDLLEDPAFLEALRQRIRTQMKVEKQQNLIIDFIDNLKETT